MLSRRDFMRTAANSAAAGLVYRFGQSKVIADQIGQRTFGLVEQMSLAGTNLLGCLNRDANCLPYWHMAVDRSFHAEYQHRKHCNGHNVGRWWYAMLQLQTLTGFDFTASVEAAMLENTWLMTRNPSGILLDAPDASQSRSWYLHSYRETMLALGLLVSHRKSERARDQGLTAIARMRAATQVLGNSQLFDFSPVGGPINPIKQPFPYSLGRTIEGLLCFHETTGESLALDEAERLADYSFENVVRTDGALASGCGHHTHSYLNTLRGLLLFAKRKMQQARLDALLATYRTAIAGMITRSGFITHDIADAKVRSGGDIASAGDVAHIALLLWDHFQDPSLLDDAERLVRSRLLPAQVMEPMPVQARGGDGSDGFRDLSRRFVGAIGGSVGHVRGQTCVTDFTASALHTLIELYRRTVDQDEHRVRINFHFGYAQSGVVVRAHRSSSEATVEILNETGKNTWVRIPKWTPSSSVRLFVDGQMVEPTIQNGFAVVAGKGQTTRLRLQFALPEEKHEESWREPSATQDVLVFHWRGDEIIHVDPVGRYLTPYPKECRPL